MGREVENKFYKVDLLKWVKGTVKKVQDKERKIQAREGEVQDKKLWNKIWLATYFEIGGKKFKCGEKSCPKNAARILYKYGRLKCAGDKFKSVKLSDVWNDSKDGVYALIAVDMLVNDNSLSCDQLTKLVFKESMQRFGHAPETGEDQGAIRLTLSLWDHEEIQCE